MKPNADYMEKQFYESLSKEKIVERCMYYSKQIARLTKELDTIIGVIEAI